MVEGFTPQKSANTISQGFLLVWFGLVCSGRLLVNPLPAYHWTFSSLESPNWKHRVLCFLLQGNIRYQGPCYSSSSRWMDVKDHIHMISATVFFTLSDFRLKEIQMSEYDATTYERFSGAVRRQVRSLRVILDNLQVISNNGLRK